MSAVDKNPLPWEESAPSASDIQTKRFPAAGAVDRQQIVVLGMHRSGTSAIAGLIRAMGVYAGRNEELLRPGAQNPHGFHERRDLRKICDAVLHGAGADWWKVSEFDPQRVYPSVSCQA